MGNINRSPKNAVINKNKNGGNLNFNCLYQTENTDQERAELMIIKSPKLKAYPCISSRGFPREIIKNAPIKAIVAAITLILVIFSILQRPEIIIMQMGTVAFNIP